MEKKNERAPSPSPGGCFLHVNPPDRIDFPRIFKACMQPAFCLPLGNILSPAATCEGISSFSAAAAYKNFPCALQFAAGRPLPPCSYSAYVALGRIASHRIAIRWIPRGCDGDRSSHQLVGGACWCRRCGARTDV